MTLVIDRVHARVRAQPEAIAIACAGEPVLTYRALWDRATAIAAALGGVRSAPGTMVALHLDKGPEFVAAMLGTWIAGAAWVPVLPELPEARRRLILAETRAPIAVVASDRVPGWLASGCTIVDARAVGSAHDHPAGGRAAGDLAYVIYTSGSTGQPKGVRVPQRGLVPLVDAQIAAFALHPGDRCLWLLSPGFDASVSDVCTALVAGATLYLEHPGRLDSASGVLEILRRRAITHCDLPPSLLPLLDPEAAPSTLRTLIIGGEVAPPAAVRAWAGRVRVVNVYGPTETTVCSTLGVCDPAWERPLIGRPLAGTELAIIEGELWIGGAGVADGYLDRPELTAAKFVTRDGARWFRTGDRVRAHADGEIELLGRLDRQLKLHGLLIAPEEIEARLREHAAVAEVVVVAQREADREWLVAYVVLASAVAPGEALIARWREHLARHLDRRAIPHRFVIVDELPRTPSGKLDRTAPAAPRTGDPPATATERALAAIWARLLGAAPHRGDDFFALGGDSLAVIEHVGLAELAGLAVSARLIYTHPTLEALAGAIDRGDDLVDVVSCAELIADLAELRPGPRSVPDDRPGAIVVTGGTGFLGARVIAELLARTDRPIRCLGRGEPGRLVGALARAGATDQRGRATWVPGDLARPRLGLDEARWHALAAECSVIVHAAAEVSLARPYRALRASTVVGTAHVLELAALAAARVHHVSTLSVFVGSDRAPGELAEHDPLETAGRLHGGYAQAKWAAEYLAHEAGATIYRCGLLTGDTTTGAVADRDWLTWFLRGLARVGAYPSPERERRVDVTPIDHASRALAELVLANASGTFHLAGAHGATLAELVAALERAGIAMRPIDAEAWPAAVEAQARAGGLHELSAALLGARRTVRSRACDVFQATGMTFDTRRTTAVVGPGPAVTPALLDRYVARALEGL